MQYSTTNTAKNSHVSGSHRIIRLKPLHAALRHAHAPLALGLTGLLLLGTGAGAEDGGWDCRAAPDGRGWECYKDGQLAEQPGPREAEQPVVVTPLSAPAVQETRPIGATDEAASTDTAAPTARPAAEPTPAQVTPVPARRATVARPVAGPPPGQAASQAFQDAGMPDLLQPDAEVVSPALAPGQAVPPAPESIQVDESAPTATEVAESPSGPPPAAPAQPAAAATPAASPTRAFAGGIDEGIDWVSCHVGPQPATRTAPDRTAPIELSADAVVAEFAPQQAVFSGNVRLVQDGLQMRAERLSLNRSTGEVNAEDGFVLSQPDIRIAGSSAYYQLASGQGQAEKVSYRVTSFRARGDAEHAEFLGDGRSRFSKISYTTCAPGDADWLLSAEALELDQAEGFGTARHAKLQFMGVPILYVPTFTFPIDDRRRSGVLVPSVGNSSNSGVELSVPYYFNLAPNYDLTLTPRLLSKRGVMLGGEFRFLTETTDGNLSADFLPNDREYTGSRDDRGSVALRSHTLFNPRTAADVRLNYVSDNDYLSDLGGNLAVASTTHLERAAELRYYGDSWDLLGRVQGYQTIDDAIPSADRPYSRLPQLLVELEKPDGIGGATYHLDAEYVNFYRRDSVRGHRLDLFPAISLPLSDSWWFVEPKVGARYTAYKLTDQAPGLDTSPSQLTGMLSFDSGLYFDRDIGYFGSAATHTLEPRLYYLYVPHSGQNDQPVFDTGLFDFSFDNLFRENRFNGPDRFGDANQVTLALSSRVIGAQSGAELLRASIGQILYFEDREVTLPVLSAEDDSSSALVGELAAQLGGGWQARTGLQWDPHDGSNGTIDQALAQVSYRDTDRHVFNAAYRLRDGVTEQTDLAFYWPLSERFGLIGRHNYSLQDSRLLEALAGLEYGRCCWRLRAVARKHADSSGNDHNLVFMLQLELNGLGRLGSDIDKTLERGIYGYRTDYDE